MAGTVPAVAAAVRIVERLAAERPRPMSPGALVEELGLNRSTCYNILATLQRSGWVSRTDRAAYTLGPRLLALTDGAEELVSVLVQEALTTLSRRLGILAFTAAFDGAGGFTVTAKAERASGVRVSLDIGDRFPFSAPALLRAFAAWQPAAELDKQIARQGLTRVTDRTVTDPVMFREALARVRRDGFSGSIGELDVSRSAVAAAVFDARSRVSMVVAVLDFSSELDASRLEVVGPAVREAADHITEQLRGTPPAGYPVEDRDAIA